MDGFIRSYNTKIRELLELIAAELPQNSTIDTIHRKFRAALVTDRTLIIEESGPQLWQYRDYIADGKWDALINNNWDDEIDNTNNAISDNMDKNSLKQIVELLRKVWDGYDETNKSYVKKSLKKLLSVYVKYIKAKAEYI